MIGNYKVITLCGSTRFKDEFLQVQKELTLQGNIVISVGLFGHAGDFEVWENMNEGTLTKTKEMLDDMHKRKIDMADEIFVINVGGYIGDSTKSEIEYAKEHDKIVRYLENNLNRDNINNAIYLDEYKKINNIYMETQGFLKTDDILEYLSYILNQKEVYLLGSGELIKEIFSKLEDKFNIKTYIFSNYETHIITSVKG